jgi:multicomponent Na+:H+ antiporter subunit D
MADHLAVLLALALPSAAIPLIALLDHRPNAREAASVTASVLLFGVVLYLLHRVMGGQQPEVHLFDVMPGLSLDFAVEPLGMLFATVASGLWIVNTLYSIGYMRGNEEKHQTRFYVYFAVAIASSMGIAFAGNLLTLFIFYEVLTLSTYPLVAHKETPEAKTGARTYVAILLGTSIGFFLVAVVWTWTLTGTLDFTPGGILAGHIDPGFAPILLALYAFGIGKAALMPFHRWLPAAMVAPTPVSALLHAVAVVKAGVFTIMKVGVYVFGIDFLARTGASVWLMWIAATSILIASLVALSKDDLKARLAYSTVSQLSYITLGMALATRMGVTGGAMHIAMHAMGKITLFMCAGGIYVAAHKTKVSEMAGLGRKMPFTFIAFLLGSLSIIGVPPFGGAWSKWYLMLGAADAQEQIMILVLLISSLLNIAYLIPVPARAFFLPSAEPRPLAVGAAATWQKQMQEAPLLCVLPPVLTALGCIVLFFYAGGLYDLIAKIPLVSQ